MDEILHDGLPKKVLVVDDHPVVRVGLRQFFDSQGWLQICGEADTAEEALAMVPEILPDLIIADFALPSMSGIDLVRELKGNGYGYIATIVISSHDESSHALPAIEAGALGYVMKDAAGKLLINAIKKVLRGVIHLSPAMTAQVDALLAEALDRRDEAAGDSPEGMEREVFQWLGQGKSISRIAELLRVSKETVDEHLTIMQNKLGLENHSALIREAVSWVACQPAFDVAFLRRLASRASSATRQPAHDSSNPSL